jgi:uncharacterized protein with HEPN domain
MRDEDRARVLHMIEAAESIAAFIAGRSRGELEHGQMLLFAVERAIDAYFDIDRAIVWRAATEEVPALLVQLRALAARPGVEGAERAGPAP